MNQKLAKQCVSGHETPAPHIECQSTQTRKRHEEGSPLCISGLGPHSTARVLAMVKRKAFASFATGAFFTTRQDGMPAFVDGASFPMVDALLRFASFCIYNALDQPVYQAQIGVASATKRVNAGVDKDIRLFLSLSGVVTAGWTSDRARRCFTTAINLRNNLAAHVHVHAKAFSKSPTNYSELFGLLVDVGPVPLETAFSVAVEHVYWACQIISIVNMNGLFITNLPDTLQLDIPTDLSASSTWAATVLRRVQEFYDAMQQYTTTLAPVLLAFVAGDRRPQCLRFLAKQYLKVAQMCVAKCLHVLGPVGHVARCVYDGNTYSGRE